MKKKSATKSEFKASLRNTTKTGKRLLNTRDSGFTHEHSKRQQTVCCERERELNTGIRLLGTRDIP